jgi:hypothetical protein
MSGTVMQLAAVKTADGLRFFVNGKLLAKKDFQMPVRLDAPESFELGQCMAKEIRISRSARYRGDYTPAERFEADADTLALYHCDEAEGEVLHDSSGNNYHARLEGNVQWVRGLLDPVVLKPVPDAWIKEVAAEPAERQLARVLKRLGERNPGFDGKAFSKITDGAVTELWLNAAAIVDIDPVRALPKLQVIRCGPGVEDLSPLKGLPLKEATCEFKAERDPAVLRSAGSGVLEGTGQDLAEKAVAWQESSQPVCAEVNGPTCPLRHLPRASLEGCFSMVTDGCAFLESIASFL